jgi:molybdopterin converting factor small subunit
VNDVLSFIKKQYGTEAFKLAKTMLIIVNGQSILLLKHYKTALKDGDEVGFLPICGGG